LRSWLGPTGSGPSVEFEALLEVFYAEQASKEDVMADIDAIRRWAEGQTAENVAFARLHVETAGRSPTGWRRSR
jgi:hypothetical protein